ncbi:MAG: Uma2 family endonuclease, partial [Bacteroidota bacterium]
MITDIQKLDFNKRYTYADYLSWHFSEMVELIRGKIYRMFPAPGQQHQRISGNLFLQIGLFLRETPCQLYHAPFDVRLPLPLNQQIEAQMDTVVQPDLCVICDPEKLRPEGC